MASLSNINGLFDVHSTGAILFSTSHGASGQILRSNGNAAPTWVDASTVIGGPYLPLSGGTLTGATATASGISFTVGGALTVTGNSTFNANVAIGGAVVAGRNLAIYNTNADNEIEFIGADYTNIYSNTDSTMAVEVIGDGELLLATKGGNLTIATGGSSTFTGNVTANGYLTSNGSFTTSSFWGTLITAGTGSYADFALIDSGTTRIMHVPTGTGNVVFLGSITAASASIPTMSVNTNFLGSIFQYGSTFRTSSFINLLNNTNTKKLLETAYFTHTVSNQAVNIQFPNVAMQGYYKITLSGSYSQQDISGKLTKVIPFGYNPNGSIWRTGNSQSEITIATGGVSTNFTIGNLAWDSTNSKFIVPIYKLTNTGNSVKILIEYFGGAANNLKDVNLSSNYIQTAPSPFNVRQYQNIRDRLGIGTTSPSQKLDVNGLVKHLGLDMTAGVQVDQTTSYTKTLTGTANTWRPTGIDNNDIGNSGSYLVQVFSNDHSGAGPANYSWYWTGTMSWYVGGTNNNVTSEIYLQGCGHHTNMVLELRTKVNYNSAAIPFAELEWKSATSFVNSPNWIFKFRRLM